MIIACISNSDHETEVLKYDINLIAYLTKIKIINQNIYSWNNNSKRKMQFGTTIRRPNLQIN